MTTETPAAPAPGTTPAIPTDAAGLAARDAELNQLFEHDPNRYQYEGNGRWANEHLAIRKAQQAQTGKPDATEPDSTDGTEADEFDPAAPIGEVQGEQGEDDDDEAAEADEREALTPWQPPEGKEVAEHAKPHLEALDAIASDEEQRDQIINLYEQMVEAQRTRFAEADKTARTDLVAELKTELGDGYAGFKSEVDAAFNELPQDLRSALRSARLPDGRLLLSMPEAVHMVRSLSRHQDQSAIQPRDSRSAMQQELRDLDQLMTTDIDQYHRPWRGTGMSASDRRLQIVRELASDAPAKPNAADIRAEIRDLEQLRARDMQMFQFGSWPGARSPADRLHQLQAGRG